MSNNLNKNGAFMLEPGQKLPEEMLEKLNEINKNYSKTRNFSQYVLALEQLFKITPILVTEDSKRFLGGFMEGEASMNLSAKKHTNATFGLLLDPEFSITQHVNGFRTLHLALKVFQTGRVRHKAGSNATMVFIIDNRDSLEEKVVPFYETYVKPFGSPAKVQRLKSFIKLLALFKQDGHRNAAIFRDEMLPIWDSMRMQRGQSNETFASLEEAQRYVTDCSSV